MAFVSLNYPSFFVQLSGSIIKPGITFELLDQEAYRFDDNEFAGMMQKARKELFQKILVPDLHIIKL